MKYIKVFEEFGGMEKRDWRTVLVEAASAYESDYPNNLAKLKNLTADQIDDNYDLYNSAAMVIVEPNVYLGEHNLDLGEYYDIVEDNIQIASRVLIEAGLDPNWKHVVKLVEEIGY
jgi:hypothetical protein